MLDNRVFIRGLLCVGKQFANSKAKLLIRQAGFFSFIHMGISFPIAFIDNSIIAYGWQDTIGKSDFCRKNHKKHLTRVQNYADDETIRQGEEKQAWKSYWM